MLPINQELQAGRYKITKQIGQGKRISFYQVYDKVLGKTLLLKETLRKTTPDQIEFLDQKFIREGESLAEILHDGFIRVFDYFQIDDYQYLLMEIVYGENIEALLKTQTQPFSLEDVVNFGEQIIASLNYLHKRNPPCCYINLKPKNLFLTTERKIKLLPTEIYSIFHIKTNQPLSRRAFEDANLNYLPLEAFLNNLDSTSQRVILNSYEDESEEILLQPPDVRSDIYALGAILYHLATANVPTDALERSINLLEKNPDPLIPPHKLDPEISLEISDILMKALEIKREDRFVTIAKMQAALLNAFVKLNDDFVSAPEELLPTNQNFDQHLIEDSIQDTTIPAPDYQVQFENIQKGFKDNLIDNHSFKNPIKESNFNEVKEVFQIKNDSERVLTDVSTKTVVVAEQRVDKSENVVFTNSIDDSASFEELIENEEVFVNFENVESEENFTESVQTESVESDQELFSYQPRSNNFFKSMAVGAVLLVLMGVGIWGALRFTSINATESNSPLAVQQQAEITSEPKEEILEAQPESELEIPVIETVAETQPEPDNTLIETTSTPVNNVSKPIQSSAKPNSEKAKPIVSEKIIEKSPKMPPQTAKNSKKKKVTVDDLINDTPKKKVTVDDLINDN